MTRPLSSVFSMEDQSVTAERYAAAATNMNQFRLDLNSVGGLIESVPLEDIPLYLALPYEADAWEKLFGCKPADRDLTHIPRSTNAKLGTNSSDYPVLPHF